MEPNDQHLGAPEDYVAATAGAPATELPCPLCRGTEYEWGLAEGYNDRVTFRREVTFRESLRGEGKRRPVRARRCLHCGNIQMFSD